MKYKVLFVVEAVDREANIEKLLPFLGEVLIEGLVTKESIHVYRYQARRKRDSSSSFILNLIFCLLEDRP